MKRLLNRSGKLFTLSLAMLAISTATFPQQAEARRRFQGFVPADLRMLFQALDNIIDCNFDVAKYRVRTVKILTRLKRGPNMDVLRLMLQKTQDALEDRYLTPMEKFQIGVDCLSQAMPLLISYYADQPGQKGSLGAALRCIQLARKLARAAKMDSNLYSTVGQVYSDTRRALFRHGNDNNIQVAMDAVQKAAEVATDRFLSDSEKQAILDDCSQVAVQAIRSSHAYRYSF